ncbi:MAG: hypothetical protein H6R15_181 [Proteobacteria bacterium]|nr:hypothetical protein [Pseudomonadota bacterium]
MRASGKSDAPEECPAPAPTVLIDALRQRGEDRFDPVRFRYIEALARRAADRSAAVQHLIADKLTKALDDYRERQQQARELAGNALLDNAGEFPAAADDLQLCYAAGDFRGVQRRIAGLAAKGRNSALAELLAEIGQDTPAAPAGIPALGASQVIQAPGELKALSYFRSTWSQLNVEQQLAQALAQAPANAGPLNSHRLALQALTQMRDISPDYLKHFMSYIDTLFWLDQTEIGRSTGPRNAEGDKRRKSSRRNGG